MREARIETPFGTLRAVHDGRVLVRLGFGEPRSSDGADGPLVRTLRAELAAYVAGARPTFSVPPDLGGTPFQQAVWDAVACVPSGETVGYGALAARLGRSPGAARAVGAALGANPVLIVVPCHRAVGAGGALTGYAGGVAAKRALLAHEARDLFAAP